MLFLRVLERNQLREQQKRQDDQLAAQAIQQQQQTQQMQEDRDFDRQTKLAELSAKNAALVGGTTPRQQDPRTQEYAALGANEGQDELSMREHDKLKQWLQINSREGMAQRANEARLVDIEARLKGQGQNAASLQTQRAGDISTQSVQDAAEASTLQAQRDAEALRRAQLATAAAAGRQEHGAELKAKQQTNYIPAGVTTNAVGARSEAEDTRDNLNAAVDALRPAPGAPPDFSRFQGLSAWTIEKVGSFKAKLGLLSPEEKADYEARQRATTARTAAMTAIRQAIAGKALTQQESALVAPMLVASAWDDPVKAQENFRVLGEVMARRIERQNKLIPTSIGGTRGTQGPQAQGLQAQDPGLERDRAEIIAALQRAGVENPTEDQIQEVYQQGQGQP